MILIYLSNDIELVHFRENDIRSTRAIDRFKIIAHRLVLNFKWHWSIAHTPCQSSKYAPYQVLLPHSDRIKVEISVGMGTATTAVIGGMDGAGRQAVVGVRSGEAFQLGGLGDTDPSLVNLYRPRRFGDPDALRCDGRKDHKIPIDEAGTVARACDAGENETKHQTFHVDPTHPPCFIRPMGRFEVATNSVAENASTAEKHSYTAVPSAVLCCAKCSDDVSCCASPCSIIDRHVPC